MSIQFENIETYRTLFRGRQDIYAVRWEKDGKTGYMPAYNVDWSDYNIYKSNGGSFKDYSKKENKPLTDEVLKRHLQGTETIGIYPLLQDNTSVNRKKKYRDFGKMKCSKFGNKSTVFLGTILQ
jgi:hypothetical protein